TNKHMPNDNRISATLAPADKTAVLDAINIIKTKLPFLVNLSSLERRAMPKMSDKTLAFDEKCVLYMAAHPELLPGFVTADEVMKDRTLRLDLTEVLQELQQVTQGVSDTVMLASSEAYKADLAFYQNARQAAQRGVMGADTIYNDLSERFPGRIKGQAHPPAAPTQ